ncbi:Teichoic acid/polysaccharide glycosyl transferase [Latilactobacillus sakei]|nr:Teichoic acid/polysaccharide glycosyl transferase [Latilactobacillus sakei]
MGVGKTMRHYVKKNWPIIFILAYSLLVMLFVTKSSPLYYQNDWVDLNCFLTVGKGWHHGLIPYKDLFEQKGPVLYLIYLLADLITAKSYFGVYLIESVLFCCSLLLIYKIARYYSKKTHALLSVIIVPSLLFMSPTFSKGGSVEELMMPTTIYLFYLLVKLAHQNFELSKLDYLMSGMLFGCVLWAKYTLIGGYLGFFLALSISLIMQRKWRALWQSWSMILLGSVGISVIVLLYFKSQNALYDLYFNYFYANTNLYDGKHVDIVHKMIASVVYYMQTVNKSWLLYGMLIIGLVVILVSNGLFEDVYIKFIYCTVYISMVVTVLLGLRLGYVMLPLMAFMVLPLIYLIKVASHKIEELPLPICVFLGCLGLMMVIGSNTNINESRIFPNNQTVHIDKNGEKTNVYQTAQQNFAEIINKSHDQTLLNYRNLDMGFYRASGVLPTTKYFMTNNIPHDQLPEILDTQNRLITQKKVNFVVLRLPINQDYRQGVADNVLSNYRKIAQHSQFDEHAFTYYLFKKK